MAGITKLDMSDAACNKLQCYSLGDTTARVTPPSNQRVGSSNNIFVEKASRPYLARHESATQNTDEEANSIERSSVVRSTRKRRRNRSDQKATDESKTGAKSIAKRASNTSHNERSR